MRRRTRGQALLEFALVVPLFLAIFVGIIDFGRVVWANDSLANAAREAARFAIVHGGSASTVCPVGPPSEETVIPIASTACPYPSPSKQMIKDVAAAALVAGGADVAVTVCYSATFGGCTGDTNATGATNGRGQYVTVVVTSRVDLVVPALLGRSSFDVEGRSTMRINH